MQINNMEKIRLSTGSTESASTDIKLCIICQKSFPTMNVTCTENGRKRVREAASTRDDIVAKRLKTVGDEFVYHMNNSCYKNYTMQKSLSKIENNPNTGRSSQRKELAPRAVTSRDINIYETPCVICGQAKKGGKYDKYRISEANCAERFLEATIFLQDEVYVRTCDLQDVHSVFGADIYYHGLCMKQYLRSYERKVEKSGKNETDRPENEKKKAWSRTVIDIEAGFRTGDGFEISTIRDTLNKELEQSNLTVTNREVKILLVNHFGTTIVFSQPKQVNKSLMVFSHTACSADSLAETIRGTNVVRDCASQVRASLLEYDFDLNDRFCDSNDLRQAWQRMVIPDPLLDFLSVLFNFDKGDYLAAKQSHDVYEDSEDTSDYSQCGKLTNCKLVRMQALFQIIFYDLHNGRRRTPLHTMNSQTIHDTCKSKTLIGSFNRLGLCSSYEETMHVQTNLATYIARSSDEVVPLPSHFDPEKLTSAAFDNFDHNEATLSGKDSCHDTVLVVFQTDDGNTKAKPKLSETDVIHGPKAFHEELKCQQLQEFFKPAKKPTLPETYRVSETTYKNDKVVNEAIRKDVAWSLSRVEFLEDNTVNIKPDIQSTPSWSGTNALWSEETIPVARVGFLPVLPYPVTQYDTVFSAMKNLQSLLSSLQQSKMAVTCDEGVYRIAREIQLIRPQEFDNLVLCLGSFHMAKVGLACIGKYLRSSGAEEILVESSVFGINVVDSVLSGKHYNRSVKGLQMLSEALGRLQIAAFFAHNSTVNYKEEISTILQLKTSTASRNSEEAQMKVKNLVENDSPLLRDFSDFITKNTKSSENFLYWNTFQILVETVQNLIRSDREGNWELHLATVQSLLPLFSAFDSTNYVRWGSLYLEDMLQLPESAPEIYTAFMNGGFAVKRTSGQFKAVGMDMALEQTINRSQKSNSGIIGNTKRKQFVARWDIVYHEILSISNLHRELTGISDTPDMGGNHECNPADTKTIERNVQAIMDFISSKGNPYAVPAKESKLHNILTKVIASDEVRAQLLRVIDIGTEAYENLRKSRFIDQTAKISDTIHRVNIKNLQTMQSERKATTSAAGKKVRQKEAGYQRLIDIAQSRGTPLEELISYDLSSFSYLFDSQDGLMKKAAKNVLVTEIEKNLTDEEKQPVSFDDGKHTTVIVDVMATLRKMKTKETKTFGAFCDKTIKFIFGTVRYAARVDFVFDSYGNKSVKDSERQRRQTTSPIELAIVSRETPLPVKMDTFWPSKANKYQLEKLFHEQVIQMAGELYTKIHVVASNMSGDDNVPCKQVFDGDTSTIDDLQITIDEADERIIPHAMHAVKMQTKRIIVLSPDTDVTVLLLYYLDKLQSNGLQQLWVKAGVADSTRFVPLHTLSNHLGIAFCHVLPAIHTLTGCDYTSKFGTKNAALKADPVTYLADFGRQPQASDLQMANCEAYLVKVMKVGSKCKTMDELRVSMYFHSKNKDRSSLPPTSHATRAHIRRALLATYEMRSVLNPERTTLDPCDFGYIKLDGLLVPDMATRLVPECASTCCKCQSCATIRCACQREGLACCKFCSCSVSGKGCLNPI